MIMIGRGNATATEIAAHEKRLMEQAQEFLMDSVKSGKTAHLHSPLAASLSSRSPKMAGVSAAFGLLPPPLPAHQVLHRIIALELLCHPESI